MIGRIFLAGLVWGLASSMAAQGELFVSLQCEDCYLQAIVERLEEQYGLAFAYQSDLLSARKASVDWNEKPLADALAELFSASDVVFEVSEPPYIVLRKQEPLNYPADSYFRMCGEVVDEISGEPLVGAYILIGDGGSGTQTDTNGGFAISLPVHEVGRVTISYLGYEKTEILFTEQVPPACPTYALSPDIQSTPVATISEFTVDMLEPVISQNKYTFRPERIPTLPGWGEPDLLRSLQLLPGISSPDGTASNLQIRGGTSDQNLLLWDGITIYQSGHFFGQQSAFNPYLVQSVDVYRGGFGAEYGGRLAGVIDIKSKPEVTEEARYGLGMNLISAHALAEIPLVPNKLSLSLGARRSFADLIRSTTYQKLFDVVFQNSRLTDNAEEIQDLGLTDTEQGTDFYYQDLNAKLSWAISPNDRLGFSAYGGLDRFAYDFRVINIGSNDRIETGNWGSSIWYEHDWNADSRASVRMAYSRFRRNYQLTYSFNYDTNPTENALAQDNNIREWNLSYQQEWDFSPKHQLRIGGQLIRQGVDYSYFERNNQDEQEFTGFGFQARTAAWHATYDWRPSYPWTFSLGLRRVEFLNRVEREFRVLDDDSWQPRWRLSWRAKQSPLSFNLAGGWHQQFIYQVPISFNELSTDDQLWVIADNYFPSLRARDWQFNAAWNPGNWGFELTYYRKLTTNISARDLSIAFNANDPLRYRGEAHARGLDLLLRFRAGGYRSWLAYSNSLIEQTFVSNGQSFTLAPDHDQRHRLNITQMLSLDKWDFSLNWQLSSGLPFSEPRGISTFFDETGELQYQADYGLPNNARLPLTHRLDLAANYKFSKPKWRGKIGLSVYNLYNQYNAFDYDHYVLPPDPAENREEAQIVRLERRMLGFTPNLFVQFEW